MALPIDCQANHLVHLAQITADVFDTMSPTSSGDHPNYVMNSQQNAQMTFLLNELCARTIQLERDIEAMQSASLPSTKAA
jgi:hypothetical protein